MKNLFRDFPSLQDSNWHIHTCFSPCADTNMTIDNIIDYANKAELKTIALVDHFHQPECDIIGNITRIKKKLANKKTKINIIVGAELSAYGIEKYSDSIDINKNIDYRLYACNHYSLDFWEHPEDTSPQSYAKHILEVLKPLLISGRADCIAHPFSSSHLKNKFSDYNQVTEFISDSELLEILDLGKRNNVVWEINIKMFMTDKKFMKRYINAGKKAGVTFHLGTDAHHLTEINPKTFF